MSKSWTIGSAADCDLVLNRPTISGHHCLLSRVDDGFVLEDLGSTNGTYVHGERINARTRVMPGDPITLGQTIAMPWPTADLPPGYKVLRLGREPDNDLVVDLPIVSSYHAQVLRLGASGGVVIEDLGSSNGTALGSPDRKVLRAALTASDTIYLGTHPIPAAQVLARLAPAPAPMPTPSPTLVVGIAGSGPGRDQEARPDVQVPERTHAAGGNVLAAELARVVTPPWRLAVLLVQAPLAALLIVLALGGEAPAPATPEGGPAGARAVAAVLFWLGLAAVWFGLSDALLASPPEATRSRPRRVVGLLSRFAWLGAICGLQCLLAWLVVAIGAGLKGTGPPALALLVLASAVGLALGLAIVALAPHRALAWAVLPLVLLSLWLLGGQRQPLPRMATWARLAANALPTRWAFEGLLLLESERRPAPESPRLPDLAEDYFPAATDRMGVKADAIALGAMLVGLAASAAVIASGPGPGPGREPEPAAR